MRIATGARILVVDDHVEMSRLLADQLGDAGYRVVRAGGGREALKRARAELPDLVITDLRMGDVDGLDVLAGVHELDPGVPVIVMTAFGAIDTAVEAIKRGAFHYLTKPFELREMLLFVERALSDRDVRSENAVLRRDVGQRVGITALVGASEAMVVLQDVIRRTAPSPAPVLITGESGSGKELVARALHDCSPRRHRPFVAVSCCALAADRLDSDLFGHTRGAFAGATATRRGLFAEANGGTLFLDEIGDMPAELQAKLLRVLDDGEVRAVGSDTVRCVDVRIVAATNQHLEEHVEAGRLRSDLFFRLNVVRIAVPPLRERRGDVAELVERFLARARVRNPAAKARRFSSAALKRLEAYSWPGNVRELENIVERLVILSAGEEIAPATLDPILSGVGSSPLDAAREKILTLRELEAHYIEWVVARCGGNKTRAAELLGIDASTIYRRERERGAAD
jgi:two-component system, NtrC family, response regulator HydG